MAEGKTAKGKNPAAQWYWADWLRDPALRSVTSGARGLWMDMLCLMWECVPRGHLQTPSGKPYTTEMLCRASGNISKEEVDGWLEELENSGVLSRSTTGVIYSRRMVRDEHKRALCREAGKKGGNPTLKGGSKGGAKGHPKGGSNPNPTPSTSSSSSTSVVPSKEETTIAATFTFEGCNESIRTLVCDDGKTTLLFEVDPTTWQWEFLKKWNRLPGVAKHSETCLSDYALRQLMDRFRENDWDWKSAMAMFPINWPSKLSLITFLEKDKVQQIVGGKYVIPDFAKGNGNGQRTGKGTGRNTSQTGAGQRYDAAGAAERSVDEF